MSFTIDLASKRPLALIAASAFPMLYARLKADNYGAGDGNRSEAWEASITAIHRTFVLLIRTT